MPGWLHILSIAALLLGFGCAIAIALDELRQPQHMWIMNVLGPVTALFGTVVTLWGISLFRSVLRTRLEVDTPEFWFMMQIAMLAGFATSYPVNWVLLRKGIKEKM